MQSKDDYRKQGYFLAKNLIDADDILTVEDDVRNIFSLYIRKEATDDAIGVLYEDDFGGFLDCAKHALNLMSLHRLASHTNIDIILCDLGFASPALAMRPYLSLSSRRLAEKHHFYWKANQHQDWYSLRGSLDSVVAWMPLTRMSYDLGYLEVAPGSHLQGLLPHVQSGPTFEIVDDHDFKWAPILMDRGDVLFFSTLLVHRSGTNTSANIRWSASFRYNNSSESQFVNRNFPYPFSYVRPRVQDHYWPSLAEINSCSTKVIPCR